MRLHQLTFTRFLAAFAVVCFHFVYHQPNIFYPFNILFIKVVLQNGDLAVPYFFVLSGFILTVVYSQPDRKNFAIIDFYILRLSRIMPAYIISCLFLIPIFIKYGFPSLISIVLNLLLLQGWSNKYTINYASWSLTSEIFFYFLFPYLFTFLKNKSLIIIVLLTITSLLSYYFLTHHIINKFIFFPPPILYIFHFLLGIILGLLSYPFLTKSSKDVSSKIELSTVLVCILITLLGIIVYKFNANIHNDIIITFLFGLLIVTISLDKSIFSKVFDWWPLILLGEISYSFYILQFPFRYCYNEINAWLYTRFPYSVFQKDTSYNFWAFTIYLLIISLICYRFVEQPIGMYVHKRFKKANRISNETKKYLKTPT